MQFCLSWAVSIAFSMPLRDDFRRLRDCIVFNAIRLKICFRSDSRLINFSHSCCRTIKKISRFSDEFLFAIEDIRLLGWMSISFLPSGAVIRNGSFAKVYEVPVFTPDKSQSYISPFPDYLSACNRWSKIILSSSLVSSSWNFKLDWRIIWTVTLFSILWHWASRSVCSKRPATIIKSNPQRQIYNNTARLFHFLVSFWVVLGY